MNLKKVTFIAIFWLWFTSAGAQKAETLYLHSKDTTTNAIRIWHTPSSEKLVILLPPYGGTHRYYETTMLPQYLSKSGVDFAVAFPGFVGYHHEGDVKSLDSLIRMVMRRYKYKPDNVIIGGFSAGGYGALRYALLKLKGEADLAIVPRAIFSVDAPIDIERWFNGMELVVKRINAASDNPFFGECNYLVGMFRDMLGGSPADKPEAYRDLSIVSSALTNGGNAQYFKDMPVRLYTEPDMNFYNEYGLDYYSTNSIDQVAFANILKIQGNKNVSLILTTGKGYRADLNNMRMPHSWSIVAEEELAEWVNGIFNTKP